MLRPFAPFAVATALSLGGAIALGQEPSTIKPIASVLQIMQTMTIPFSDAIFLAASEPPKTAAAWTALRGPAVALAESGNLLMIGPRARDKDQWMKMARQEVDAAEAVLKAIDTRNADRLSAAGDALYETCETCHNRYKTPTPAPK
jgi:cytochrome c556